MKGRGAISTDLVIPDRKPLKPVHVVPCRDQVCPPGSSFSMDFQNFKNLQENVINSESYIEQLQNLLKSISK